MSGVTSVGTNFIRFQPWLVLRHLNILVRHAELPFRRGQHYLDRIAIRRIIMRPADRRQYFCEVEREGIHQSA
jgi:hypothetical protein